uniref:Uncharacterized protein n=1 Tax=Amphimedon queenslandica TaxID=400682 RepID=A0A1X7VGW8_AMPQE
MELRKITTGNSTLSNGILKQVPKRIEELYSSVINFDKLVRQLSMFQDFIQASKATTQGQSLAESSDDHESQSTVVATTVNAATADVQSVVAHSPSPSSTPSTTTTTTTEVSVGATPPTTSLQSPSLP